jgi:[ribosomal protein S5]-alanine N-acetyltransferase
MLAAGEPDRWVACHSELGENAAPHRAARENSQMTFDLGRGFRLADVLRADKCSIVELLNNREIHRRTLRIPYPYTDDDFEQWFAHMSEQCDQPEPARHWAIRDAADRTIGGIGLEPPSEGQTHRAEIGYWLGEPYWGQAIVPAAVRAVCRHAFEDLELIKITATIFAFNMASIRVVEKCGFEFEGYLKQHYMRNGELVDAKAYALLKQ